MYIDTTNASTGRVCLNAYKADKLATARTITLKGDATGSVSFDGSQNVDLTVTIGELDDINEAIGTLPNAASNGIKIESNTIKHTNAVTAATASEGGSARTLAFGGSFNIPSVTYDAQGHITGKGSIALKLPANPNTDTKVTSVGNHYTPSADTASALSVDASSTTKATWGSTSLVTGVNLQRDAKGHVTGVTVDSIQMPANPNTDTNTAHAHTAGNGLSISGSGGISGTTTYSLADSGVTAGTYGPSADVSGSNGKTILIPQINVDQYGRITSVVNRTYTSVNTDTNTNTTYDLAASASSTNGNVKLNLTAGGSGSGTDSVTIKGSGATSVTTDANGVITINSTDTNTDTHYTTKLFATDSSGTAHAATSNGGTYLRLFDNNTARQSIKITGSGATSVSSDANGVITISSTDTNTNTHYTTGITAGASGTTSNSATSNPYIKIKDDSTHRSQIQIKGSGATAVSSDANGVITISSTDNNTDTNTTYDLAASASSTNGNVKLNLTAGGSGSGTDSVTIKGSGATTVTTDANGVITINSTDNNTTSFTITATATDDDIVVLTGTNGTNKVTFDAKHAKKGPSSGYTSDNTVTSISGSGGSGTIKVPQITVDAYGHVTAAADEGVTITLPTIPPSLKNPNSLTIGNITYDGSAAKTVTAADLGITGAMIYKGTSTVAITDGGKEAPTIGGTSIATTSLQAGNVVLYGSKEFVWNGSAWELLGDEGSYKTKQTAVSDPTASGTSATFIATISQDANGKITATKKTVRTMGAATSSAAGSTGLVPAPAAGAQAKFLRGDGTWQTPTDTNTHYTTKLFATSSSGTAHAATSNGGTYLRLFDDSTARQSIKITGSGATTVSSDASGVITISSTDTNTDTKNTAGSTDTSSKIFLVGATSQAANPQTYSHGEVYVDTSHYVNATGFTINSAASLQYNSTNKCIDFVFA